MTGCLQGIFGLPSVASARQIARSRAVFLVTGLAMQLRDSRALTVTEGGKRRWFEFELLFDGSLQHLTCVKTWISTTRKRPS